MLEEVIFRDPPPGQPRVIAAFSFRHEAHLVPDFLENIRPGVHGYVAWDDRLADRALSDEPTRRLTLAKAALKLGADWLLTADPDERVERGIADWLPELVAQSDRLLWTFAVREMFSPTAYRVDGLWTAKHRMSLFPARAASVDPTVALHGGWVADTRGLRHVNSGRNIYHLRMATPERRRLRRDLYAAADPERRFQPIGYDYLDDERGMVLEPIPEGRGFSPTFVEDHGLWSPDPGDLGPVSADPYANRLARAAASARNRGLASARHVMLDLLDASPQDTDLCHVAGRFALLAGDHSGASGCAEALLRNTPGDLSARLLLAEAQVAQGLTADLSKLASALPGSPVIAALQAEVDRPSANFRAPDAQWRHVAPPDATLSEGRQIAAADLSVVVIGFRSQPGLLPAVQSLLDQDTTAEVVVVNTGGGAVAAQLACVLDRIRLITTDTPCQVGAARNIGVAASRARFVAFLAADCLAQPGWVRARLDHHHAGACAVSSAVVVDKSAGLLALAANRMRYAARHPLTRLQDVQHYGQSYDRQLLRQCGRFPLGLPSGEDTRLNRIAQTLVPTVWAPEVQTLHREPPTLRDWVVDERARGGKQAIHPPFRALASLGEGPEGLDDALGAISLLRRWRVRRLLAAEPGLAHADRRAVLAMQWLATRASRRGLLEGIADIAAANDLAAKAEAAKDRPADAIDPLEWARRLDPCDPAKALLAGKLLQELGRTSQAEAAFRDALSLALSNSEAAEQLTKLVAARDGAMAGLRCAEELALAAPRSAALWSVAASQALAAGRADWAVALGRIALGCALDRPDLHRRLGQYHLAADTPVLAAFRGMTARRLAAFNPG